MKVLTYSQASVTALRPIRHIPTKRLFDIAFSACILLILAPLFFVIALAIRLGSGEPAIYAQPRIGRGGKVFHCYKFRTMHSGAEERLQAILQQDPLLRREWSEKQKLKEDPRIFLIGKWLRRTSLDELPQFWNVVKGDLSVVGPRPYMVAQGSKLGPLAPKILSIRPGITGLWQTSGRSRTTFQERVALDAAYVERRSFYYDLTLVLKTVPQVIFPTDAY